MFTVSLSRRYRKERELPVKTTPTESQHTCLSRHLTFYSRCTARSLRPRRDNTSTLLPPSSKTLSNLLSIYFYFSKQECGRVHASLLFFEAKQKASTPPYRAGQRDKRSRRARGSKRHKPPRNFENVQRRQKWNKVTDKQTAGLRPFAPRAVITRKNTNKKEQQKRAPTTDNNN